MKPARSDSCHSLLSVLQGPTRPDSALLTAPAPLPVFPSGTRQFLSAAWPLHQLLPQLGTVFHQLLPCLAPRPSNPSLPVTSSELPSPHPLCLTTIPRWNSPVYSLPVYYGFPTTMQGPGRQGPRNIISGGLGCRPGATLTPLYFTKKKKREPSENYQ